MKKSATASDLPRMSWPGRVSRFARLREGGPGRPVRLLGMAAVAACLGLWGRIIMDGHGMNSPGPAMILLSFLWLGFLLVWLLIKAGLRDTQVTFYMSGQGTGIQTSKAQKQLDRRIGVLTRLVFLSTLKGGQWSAWQPFTPWKEVKRVDVNRETREILICGGPWDIRLTCTKENFSRALNMLRQYRPHAFGD